MLMGLTMVAQEAPEREVQTLTKELDKDKHYYIHQGKPITTMYVKLNKNNTITFNDGTGEVTYKIMATGDDGSGFLLHVVVVTSEVETPDGNKTMTTIINVVVHKAHLDRLAVVYPQTQKTHYFMSPPAQIEQPKDELELELEKEEAEDLDNVRSEILKELKKALDESSKELDDGLKELDKPKR